MMVQVAAATHVGQVRENNEDCLYVDRWVAQTSGSFLESAFGLGEEPLALAVVDGMGGYTGGAVASITAALALGSQPLEDLGEALSELSRQVADHGRSMAGHGAMGATIAGVVLTAGEARIFNVGDSRVFRLVDGYLGQVSVDDLVPDPTGVRKGFVSQSLGGPTERRLDPHEMAVPIEPGAVFLLCSDGLHDCVGRDEIASALEREPSAAVTELVTLALDAGAPDNVSVIVARVE